MRLRVTLLSIGLLAAASATGCGDGIADDFSPRAEIELLAPGTLPPTQVRAVQFDRVEVLGTALVPCESYRLKPRVSYDGDDEVTLFIDSEQNGWCAREPGVSPMRAYRATLSDFLPSPMHLRVVQRMGGTPFVPPDTVFDGVVELPPT